MLIKFKETINVNNNFMDFHKRRDFKEILRTTNKIYSQNTTKTQV